MQATRAEHLVEAIYDAEGRCIEPYGLSGETGCFQYQAGTWRAYSTTVADKVLPQTRENERYVTKEIILKWIREGVTDRGVLLTWNQGSPTGWGPGTKDCYAGVNKHGVAYDSCAYAARGLAALEAMR